MLAVCAQLLSLGSGALERSPLLTGGTAILVAALALPGMLVGGQPQPAAGGHGRGGHRRRTATAAPAPTTHTAAVVPPKPYDPTLPIDLGGVEGVTPQQQAAAENLLAVTLARLPQFADPAAVEVDWASCRSATGSSATSTTSTPPT